MYTFKKLCLGYSIVSGVYGFSRGIRSECIMSDSTLYVEKPILATMNGLIYSIPSVNIYQTFKLFGRTELEYTKKNTYISYYKYNRYHKYPYFLHLIYLHLYRQHFQIKQQD